MTGSNSDILLFGTLGCHLCDQALALIQQSLPNSVVIKQIDIVDDPALLESMALRIPVVQVGNMELNWPFDAGDIQNLWQRQPSGRRYLSLKSN
ncbi:glutaredoxin family protein [Marinomonas agarivorans]|nr:glutaredoxin family protein [Marinomonas agarivorans]